MVVTDPDGSLLTMCENGYGKRTPFGANVAGETEGEEEETPAEPAEPVDAAEGEETGDRSSMRYRKQRRGGKGLRDIRTSSRNGPVVGVLAVRDGDDIMLITTQGMVNRTHVAELRLIGRNTQGVRVMNINEGDKISSIAKVPSEEAPETPE
jgi:DNA gyrase subunit A